MACNAVRRFNNDTAMKIVIDEKIPYIADALSAMGNRVVALPGVAIANEHLRDADALLCARAHCAMRLCSRARLCVSLALPP